ncbi:MAG: LptE family protein [Tepidisphaeraceae bacterium]
MNYRWTILWPMLALGLLGCSSGGGYHWSSLYRQDISTVAVPIFTSKDYHRGVEFDVSDALVTKIEEYTPYKVTSREKADTILEGEIVSVQPLTVVLDPNTNTPQEQEYSIIVNFTWKDLRTGKILVSRQNFEQTSTYYGILGEDQNVATLTAADRLALGIVHEMQSSW